MLEVRSRCLFTNEGYGLSRSTTLNMKPSCFTALYISLLTRNSVSWGTKYIISNSFPWDSYWADCREVFWSQYVSYDHVVIDSCIWHRQLWRVLITTYRDFNSRKELMVRTSNSPMKVLYVSLDVVLSQHKSSEKKVTCYPENAVYWVCKGVCPICWRKLTFVLMLIILCKKSFSFCSACRHENFLVLWLCAGQLIDTVQSTFRKVNGVAENPPAPLESQKMTKTSQKKDVRSGRSYYEQWDKYAKECEQARWHMVPNASLWCNCCSL